MRTILAISCLLVFLGRLNAQEQEPKVIQFTGVIFSEDSTSIIPGVHVYAPAGGRGTTSNPYGFFSMAVLEGDSIIFSAVGFERVHYIIPSHDSDRSLKLLVYMKEDVTYLDEVEIFPYPTEEMFKAAVLAAEIPEKERIEYFYRMFTSNLMQEKYANIGPSPNINHRFYMDQYMRSQTSRYQPPPNPLLNPFAWANFINSLRRDR